MSNIKQVFTKKIKQNQSIESFVDEHTVTQGEIFTAIKNKDYPTALGKALKIMPTNTRIKYVCEIFYRGKYRCYGLGISRFKKQIDYYLETKDKDSIKNFYDLLKKEEHRLDTGNTVFNTVRYNIILSILDENHSLVTTVEHLCDLDDYAYGGGREDVYFDKYKKILLEVCTILYPQNQAYKVLFV